MALELQRRTWTADDFDRMVETGVLTKDDHVELIEGEIVEMSPIGSPHVSAVNVLTALLVPQVAGRAIVQIQGSVRLSERSEPQPDVALLQWRDDFYRKALPTAADVLAVMEMAGSSVDTDRRIKIPLYGRAGIAEAWLVDLPAGVIEVHRDPSPEGYAPHRTHGPGDVLAVGFDDVVVAVSDIFR